MINNKSFYPTPENLIRKMFYKLDDTLKIKYILEPSAGKGDIIEKYKEYYKSRNSRYIGYRDTVDKYITFDAIEIDNNLSSLLRGKNINIIWDDFLSFEPTRYYDLIIANFPFDRGCDHLLKAIEIQERIGGKIICLLNAETLKNPYSNNRKHLVTLLKQYDADIEYIENAFTDAERKTEVETALIYIDVPMTDNKTMFEKEFIRDNPNIEYNSFKALAPNMNKLETLTFECEMIKKSGEKLFQEKLKIDKLLGDMGIKSELAICENGYNRDGSITINDFIDKINLQYWRKFIDETDFKKRLPSKLRENFTYNMEKQKNIAFNMENVRYFYEELTKSIPQSYEEAVAKVFDDVTSKYVYTDNAWNKTIHLYNGWKTNKAYKINKKVIIPCNNGYFSYNIPNELADINIIFENISGEKDDIYKDNKVWEAIKSNHKKIETKFFILDSYKKGTLHITFKDQELLNQFNILASKGKNWLPSDFGKKDYNNMTQEEKQLVKDFGLKVEEYQKISSVRNDYLRLMPA